MNGFVEKLTVSVSRTRRVQSSSDHSDVCRIIVSRIHRRRSSACTFGGFFTIFFDTSRPPPSARVVNTTTTSRLDRTRAHRIRHVRHAAVYSRGGGSQRRRIVRHGVLCDDRFPLIFRARATKSNFIIFRIVVTFGIPRAREK